MCFKKIAMLEGVHAVWYGGPLIQRLNNQDILGAERRMIEMRLERHLSIDIRASVQFWCRRG